MKRLVGLAAAPAAAALCLLGFALHRPAPAWPTADTVFTSARCVTCLAVAPDGTLWVGTTGGVLRRDRNGAWTKFTRADGLPSHETRGLWIDHEEAVAVFPTTSAVWRDGRWRTEPAGRPLPYAGLCAGQTCACAWRGAPCVATVTDLRLREGAAWRSVPLPPSRGTHISALLPRGQTLWAALFGDDDLWAFDGKDWQPLSMDLPNEARDVTAMAADGKTLWLGTRRAGVWECSDGRWTQHLQPGEPYNHNSQAIAAYRGDLFVSTLEDGLAVRTAGGWRHLTPGELSSDAPRQMVEFGGALYVRHGNGKVDRFDGAQWTRDVCGGLPRKQVSALAADGDRLYLGVWGGWSEFDGSTWTHHLTLPELQGQPITALCPDGNTLWIGTQKHGIAEVDRATERLRWHDERAGLPDDWITALARQGPTLYAGTFVGGLARREGGLWTTVAELSGQNVTALAHDPRGGLFIATRTGVWHQRVAPRKRSGHREPDSTLVPVNRQVTFLDSEAQALCAVPGGLWVGTRTGLCFLKEPVASSQ